MSNLFGEEFLLWLIIYCNILRKKKNRGNIDVNVGEG